MKPETMLLFCSSINTTGYLLQRLSLKIAYRGRNMFKEHHKVTKNSLWFGVQLVGLNTARTGQSTARNVHYGIFPLICSSSDGTVFQSACIVCKYPTQTCRRPWSTQLNSTVVLFPMNLYLVYGSGAFQNRPTTNFPLVSS